MINLTVKETIIECAIYALMCKVEGLHMTVTKHVRWIGDN